MADNLTVKDVIFNRIDTFKKDIYSTISNILTTAGWINISSKPAVDGDVFYSAGIDGKHELYLVLTPGTFATTDTALNISAYTCRKYIPNSAGTSGAFTRKSTNIDLYFRENNTAAAQKILTTTPYILWYNVDKNRLIFIVEPYPGYGLPCCVFYLGLPNEIYIPEDIDTGVTIAYSCRNTLGKCWCQDYGMRTAATTNIQHNVINNVPIGEKTFSGKRIMYPVFYGNASEGLRGRLDGLYVLANSYETLGKGSLFSDGNGKTYRTALTMSPNASYPYDSSFTSHVIAFQIGG